MLACEQFEEIKLEGLKMKTGIVDEETDDSMRNSFKKALITFNSTA